MGGSTDQDTDIHSATAEASVQRIDEAAVQGLESLRLFGSTARNEATGLDSDVDFLAVVSDDADKHTVEDQLREIAYDVMLDHGPVVEVHVLSQSSFEQRRDHPFVRRAVHEGEVQV